MKSVVQKLIISKIFIGISSVVIFLLFSLNLYVQSASEISPIDNKTQAAIIDSVSNETKQFWTQGHIQGAKMIDVPVFVLTSSITFSGAEEFTYNLKNMKRGTIIGETTGGGAHPVEGHVFENLGVAMSLPFPEISTPKTDSMIDIGGRKLHCCVYGKGSPTVVLVSGFGAPQAYWNSVVPNLAAQTTVVTYDRAGIGKSEIGELPTHGEQAAKDLHVLLEKLGVPSPYILVGHSYGGSVVRLFALMYPETMAGLILEDAQHEDVLNEQRKILTGKDLEALEQMVARFSTPENPKTEADYRNITTEQVRKSKPLPKIPFVVLTAGDRSKAMPPMFSVEAKEKLAKLGLEMQQKLVALIPGGKQIIVEGAGHVIHGEKPEALITPVLEMIKDVRYKEDD